MLLVEDAFAVLRDAGMTPGARDALTAVLNHVIDDFDRSGVQWSQRLRYRALMATLAGDHGAVAADVVPATIMAAPTTIAVSSPVTSFAPSASTPVTQTPDEVARAVMEAMRQASIHPEAKKPLTAHIEGHVANLRRKGRGEKYLSEIGTKLRIFMTTIGDKPVHEYEKADILRYRDLIDQMPFDAIKHLKTDDPVMAIALNAKRALPLPTISATTVDAKYLTVVRGIFEYLVSKGLLATNPATGVKSEREEDGEDLLDAEIRLPFTPEIEAAVFRATSKKPKESADYWWPRFNCRQGLRLQELTQLCVSDFRVLHGRFCLDLLHFDFDGDENHALRRSELRLKSSAARRIFPVAQPLLDDGLVALIEKRRQDGGPNARLFPNETADKFGNTSSALSKRANRVVRSITGDPRMVAYSARHTFAQRCDEAGIPLQIRNLFMGHEPTDAEVGSGKKSRGKHVSGRYGSPLPTAGDLAWFDRIRFSTR